MDTELAESWLLADSASIQRDATLAFELLWAKNIMHTVIDQLRRTAGSSEKHISRFRLFRRSVLQVRGSGGTEDSA